MDLPKETNNAFMDQMYESINDSPARGTLQKYFMDNDYDTDAIEFDLQHGDNSYISTNLGPVFFAGIQRILQSCKCMCLFFLHQNGQ